MIYSLTGTLLHTGTSYAVVECGGVGFQCFTTLHTLSRIGRTGGKVTLLTHLNVREDALDLFGFSDAAELECFRLLISVSGVGPKAALSLLSELSPDKLALSIAAGDSKSLTRAQGIGKKIAERIVLELKEKIASGAPEGGSGSDISAAASTKQGEAAEAVSALVSLGFPQADASVAVGKLGSGLGVEEMIRKALKALSGNV